jgi:mandelamide amidase
VPFADSRDHRRRPLLEGADRWNALVDPSWSGTGDPGEPDLVVVKDNIDVAGLPTAVGSSLLVGVLPAESDAGAVARLRSAGYVIGPKTNMHELALGATGVNPTFGTPDNPAAPGHIAGGSSGGTAAAVAGGLCELGLGTDTGGSVRVPAALTGIAGYRPTTGRYDASGVAPLSPTRDTVGTMARTVAGLARLDAVLAAGRPDATAAGRTPLAAADLRLGVPTSFFTDELDATTQAAWDAALEGLVDHGVTLVPIDVTALAVTEDAVGIVITCFEAGARLLPYLGARTGVDDPVELVSRIASPDVRALMTRHVLPGGEGSFSSAEYGEALSAVERLRRAHHAALDAADVVGLLFPTTPVVAGAVAEITESDFAGLIRNTVPGSLAALPGVSLPIPSPGLPVGLSLDGRHGADADVLAAAAVLESAVGDPPSVPQRQAPGSETP